MARTVIDLDDAALARAMKVLGTKTKVETVNRALNEIAPDRATDTEMDGFERVADLIGERLSDVDWDEAWRTPLDT